MTVSLEGEDKALELYRAAEQAQHERQYWDSSILFLASVASSAYHPNAVYQAAWNLSLLRKWRLAHALLAILLSRTPQHDSGLLLQALVAAIVGDNSGAIDALQRRGGSAEGDLRLRDALSGKSAYAGLEQQLRDREFNSPKELRSVALACLAEISQQD